MKDVLTKLVKVELSLRNGLTRAHSSFYARLRDERGDVPGWVLVVLMTTGLVTAIWTIARGLCLRQLFNAHCVRKRRVAAQRRRHRKIASSSNS